VSYTLAWLEAHNAPESELRTRLQDALVRATDAEAVIQETLDNVLHDYAYGGDLVESAQGAIAAIEQAQEEKDDVAALLEEERGKVAELTEKLEGERDRWKEELGKELADERKALETSLEMLQARVRELEAAPKTETPVVDRTVALRAAPAHVGKVIHVNFRNGGNQSAVELYNEASTIDEDPARQDEAARLYLCALAIDPTYASARCNLGNIYFRKRLLKDAIREYDQAIKDDRRCAEAFYNRGYIELEIGESRKAVGFFLQAIEIDARFADAYFNCAMALEQSSDPHTATWHWKKYLELEPKGTYSDIARSHLLRCTPPAAPKRPRARARKTDTKGAI
jgi:tetratricopeptide (TPR) repeat protein